MGPAPGRVQDAAQIGVKMEDPIVLFSIPLFELSS